MVLVPRVPPDHEGGFGTSAQLQFDDLYNLGRRIRKGAGYDAAVTAVSELILSKANLNESLARGLAEDVLNGNQSNWTQFIKAWVPYQGPRGGMGAKDTETQEVVYGPAAQALLQPEMEGGIDMPFDGPEYDDAKARLATAMIQTGGIKHESGGMVRDAGSTRQLAENASEIYQQMRNVDPKLAEELPEDFVGAFQSSGLDQTRSVNYALNNLAGWLAEHPDSPAWQILSASEGTLTQKANLRLLRKDDRIIYGVASVAIVDQENDLITGDALAKSLPDLMKRGRLSLQHLDVLPGEILDSYTVGDKTYKTEVRPVTKEDIAEFQRLRDAKVKEGTEALFLVGRIYKDAIGDQVWEKVLDGEIRAFSISGMATDQKQKRVCEGPVCRLVNSVEAISTSSVTLCATPMNQGSGFNVISKEGQVMDNPILPGSDGNQYSLTVDHNGRVVAKQIIVNKDEVHACACDEEGDCECGSGATTADLDVSDAEADADLEKDQDVIVDEPDENERHHDCSCETDQEIAHCVCEGEGVPMHKDDLDDTETVPGADDEGVEVLDKDVIPDALEEDKMEISGVTNPKPADVRMATGDKGIASKDESDTTEDLEEDIDEILTDDTSTDDTEVVVSMSGSIEEVLDTLDDLEELLSALEMDPIYDDMEKSLDALGGADYEEDLEDAHEEMMEAIDEDDMEDVEDEAELVAHHAEDIQELEKSLDGLLGKVWRPGPPSRTGGITAVDEYGNVKYGKEAQRLLQSTGGRMSGRAEGAGQAAIDHMGVGPGGADRAAARATNRLDRQDGSIYPGPNELQETGARAAGELLSDPEPGSPESVDRFASSLGVSGDALDNAIWEESKDYEDIVGGNRHHIARKVLDRLGLDSTDESVDAMAEFLHQNYEPTPEMRRDYAIQDRYRKALDSILKWSPEEGVDDPDGRGLPIGTPSRPSGGGVVIAPGDLAATKQPKAFDDFTDADWQDPDVNPVYPKGSDRLHGTPSEKPIKGDRPTGWFQRSMNVLDGIMKAWRPFTTDRGTVGAVDEYGNKKYGKEAERILQGRVSGPGVRSGRAIDAQVIAQDVARRSGKTVGEVQDIGDEAYNTARTRQMRQRPSSRTNQLHQSAQESGAQAAGELLSQSDENDDVFEKEVQRIMRMQERPDRHYAESLAHRNLNQKALDSGWIRALVKNFEDTDKADERSDLVEDVLEDGGDYVEKPAPEGVSDEKYDSCVDQVEDQEGVDNPYAICAASLKALGQHYHKKGHSAPFSLVLQRMMRKGHDERRAHLIAVAALGPQTAKCVGCRNLASEMDSYGDFATTMHKELRSSVRYPYGLSSGDRAVLNRELPVIKAEIAKQWIPYRGPKGGMGAQNAMTGEIRYGEEASALLAGYGEEIASEEFAPRDQAAAARERMQGGVAPEESDAAMRAEGDAEEAEVMDEVGGEPVDLLEWADVLQIDQDDLNQALDHVAWEEVHSGPEGTANDVLDQLAELGYDVSDAQDDPLMSDFLDMIEADLEQRTDLMREGA